MDRESLTQYFTRLVGTKLDYPKHDPKHKAMELIDRTFADSVLEVAELLEEKDAEIQRHFVNHALKAYVIAMAAYGEHVIHPRAWALHQEKHGWAILENHTSPTSL